MKFYSILCLRIRPTSQTLSKDFGILSATASNSTNYNWQKICSQTRWLEIHLEPGNLNKTKCLERIKEPIIYKVWEALITMYFSIYFFSVFLQLWTVILVLLFDAGWDGTVQIYCITVKSNASEHTTNVCKTLHRWTKVFTYIICDFSMVFLVTPK